MNAPICTTNPCFGSGGSLTGAAMGGRVADFATGAGVAAGAADLGSTFISGFAMDVVANGGVGAGDAVDAVNGAEGGAGVGVGVGVVATAGGAVDGVGAGNGGRPSLGGT